MKFNFLIFIFLLTACKKDRQQYQVKCNNPTNNIDTSLQLIAGNWEWVSEYYIQPFTGAIFKTPFSEGYTRKLIANHSTLGFYRNAVFEQAYQYEIVMEKTITNMPSDLSNVLVFTNAATGQISNYVHFFICSDTLTLNYQFRSDAVGQEKWAKIK